MEAATNQVQKARTAAIGHLMLRPLMSDPARRARMRRRGQAPGGSAGGPLPYFSTTFCTMGSASSQVNLEPMTIETVLPDGASTNSDMAPVSEV